MISEANTHLIYKRLSEKAKNLFGFKLDACGAGTWFLQRENTTIDHFLTLQDVEMFLDGAKWMQQSLNDQTQKEIIQPPQDSSPVG